MVRKFAKGSKVILKSGGSPAIIREAKGGLKWQIELVDTENGTPTGMYVQATSLMLRHPRENEFPTTADPDDNSSHGSNDTPSSNEDEVIARRTARVRNEDAKRGKSPDRNLDNTQVNETVEVVVNAHTNEAQVQEANTTITGDNEEELPGLETVTEDEDDDEEGDPDEELEEDFPFDPAIDQDEQAVFNAADFLEARGIEIDDDKHKAKWERYLLEKKALIDQAWSVKKNAPKKQSLGVGEQVKEKRGGKRLGIIVKDERTKEDSGPMWGVLYQDETEPEHRVSSKKIKLIKDNRVFQWNVIKDSEPNAPIARAKKVGVCGYQFESAFENAEASAESPFYKHPFLYLLIHLWPGDWKEHKRNMNAAIETANAATSTTIRSNKKNIRLVSDQEWWIVWGIIFVACPCHKGGKGLFQSEREPGRAAPVIDMSIDRSKFDEVTGASGKKLISYNRFKQIKENLHHAFHDGSDSDDPWHPIAGLVDGFNANRKKWVVADFVRVLDELMSAFQPRTTKTSLLPFLSYVFRKPKPLGTEYKCAACIVTGILTYLEIQRGAKPMRLLPFNSNVGSTGACTLRLTIGSCHSGVASKERKEIEAEDSRRHLIIADSWFGSVKVAEAMKCLARKDETEQEEETTFEEFSSFHGYHIDTSSTDRSKGHELIAAVKTNSGWFPKKEIEKHMKDWPSGSVLVLECTTPETNVQLVAIGYKYNARKVLCFVMTKDAGSTTPGSPYRAKFPDQYGNTCERSVTRPEALSTYFGASNLIDAHNHARQALLGLERHWHTPNPWFRNITTIIGCCVIDAWKALKYRLPQYKKMTVEEFADRLAFDCINNPYSSHTEATAHEDIPADGLADTSSDIASRQSGFSSMPTTMFEGAAGLTSQFHNMTVSLCGGSNPSPLTMPGGLFNFGQQPAQTPHDTMVQRVKETNSQGNTLGCKRHCVICGKETRNECTHPVCQKARRYHRSALYVGTPVCSNQAKTRPEIKRLGLKNNTKSCLQLHRQEFHSQHQG